MTTPEEQARAIVREWIDGLGWANVEDEHHLIAAIADALLIGEEK